MNMPIVEKRPFVYGNFNLPSHRLPGGLKPPAVPAGYSPYAIEILREFSASEFVGKLYALTPSLQWAILRPEDATAMMWYTIARKSPHMIKFIMQGSGEWTLKSIRTETDEAGPYVAVGLSSK